MKTLFFISIILLIFSNSLCGQNQSEEAASSDTLTYSSVLPSSLSGLIKVDTGTNSQWIKYANNLTGSSSRTLRILINDTPVEVPAEEAEMEERPVEDKEQFAGVDAELDFRSGKISTVTLFLDNREVFVKGYGFQTEGEFESIIKELVSKN